MSEPRYAIAVDAGGSTSKAVALSSDGTCLATAQAGPGNPRAVGGEVAATNIAASCVMLSEKLNQRPHLILVCAAGTLSNGGSFPELGAALAASRLDAQLRLEPDLLALYFSATPVRSGSVVIVGTGTTAARISAGRVRVVRDGLGWLLGDDGSGFWLGRAAARAVARHIEGRGPATSLTDAVLGRIGDKNQQSSSRDPQLVALSRWVHAHPPVYVAQLAKIVLDQADLGDSVAQDICRSAASRIQATIGSLPAFDDGPVAVGGGVLWHDNLISREVISGLGDSAIRVESGVAGAAFLAAAQLSGQAGEHVHRRVRESLAALA